MKNDPDIDRRVADAMSKFDATEALLARVVAGVRPRWICEVCSGRLVGDDGVIFVSYREIREHRDDLATWKAAHADRFALSVAEFEGYPPPVRWHVRHDDCGGQSGMGSTYGYASGRVTTWRDVTSMSAHLLSKEWLPTTDWAQLLYRAGV